MREMNASACDALASGVRWDSPALIGSLVILGLIDAMVIGGNLLVIVAVFVSSKLRASVTNLFIASLAVADLLLGIAVLPFSAAWEVFDEVWLFGDAWCSVWLAVDVWMCTASILNLCAISLDRYVAVTRPVSYPSIMSCGRAKMLIAGVWVLSFLICFPPLVGWNDHRENATVTGDPPSPAKKVSVSPLPSVTTLSALDIPLTSAEASTQPAPFSLDDPALEEEASWLEQSPYSHILLHRFRHQKGLRLGGGGGPPGASIINSQEDNTPSSRESDWSSVGNTSISSLSLLQRAPSISAVSPDASSGIVTSYSVVTPSPSELISCPWVCELTNDAGYVVYSALGSFYIPMLVMLFFYWRIYRAAVRTTKAINQGFRTTKGSKVLGVGFGGGSGSSGGGGGGGSGGGSFGGGGCSRFDEHRLTLRIHRGRGSVMNHGSGNNCNYSTTSGVPASSEGSPPASASPRRLVRSRTQDRIRINVTYQPGESGEGAADVGGGTQAGRRGGSCRSIAGRGSTAAALASAASSAAGTALYSVHYAGGSGGNNGSSPTGGGTGGSGGSGAGGRSDYSQRQDTGSRRSSARFEGSHQHLLRVSSTSSGGNSNANSAALQRTQSARQRGSSGGESELMVPGMSGKGGTVSPGSSPTTYESISVSSATAGGEGSGSPGSSFGMSSCSVKRRQQQQQQQRRNSQQMQQQQQQQHVSRMGKRNIKAQVKRFRMETKAAKTLGIIVGGFIVCWLPFFTMYLVRAFCEDCIPPLVFSVLFWLGYCNSAINPCIYALFSKDFRFAFKRIICKCFCTGRRGCRSGGGWNDGTAEAGGAFGGGGGSWGSFRRRSNRQSGQQQQQQGLPAGQQRRLWGRGRKKNRSPPAWLLASTWARRTSGGCPNIEDCEGNGLGAGGNSLGEDSEERAGSGSGGAGGVTTGCGGGAVPGSGVGGVSGAMVAPPNGSSRNLNGNVEVIVTSDSR